MKKTKRYLALLLVIAMILTFTVMPSAYAVNEEIVVTDINKLQDAIYNATDGDTIFLDMTGSVTLLELITIDKPLIIYSNGTLTLYPANGKRHFELDYEAEMIGQAYVVMDGFTLDGGTSTDGPLQGGITVSSNTALVLRRDMTITDCKADKGGGVYAEGFIGLLDVDHDGTRSSNTICNNTADYGGGVYVSETGVLQIQGGTISDNTAINGGGGVYEDGIVYMYDGIISGNKAVNGGGVYVGETALYRMIYNIGYSNTICDNTAVNGGGVYVTSYDGLWINGGTIKDNDADFGGGVYVTSGNCYLLNGGIISNNTAANNGGGVFMTSDGAFTMNGGTISENEAGDGGGGVHVGGGTFTMNGGTISDNYAQYGVGVYMDGGSFTMNGGTISDNINSNNGGGVYMTSDGNFTMTDDAIISGNSGGSGGGVYVESGTFTMYGGTISGNEAGGGAGVYVEFGGKFTMLSGVISNNQTGGYGGGIFTEDLTYDNLMIEADAVFSGNSTTTLLGAPSGWDMAELYPNIKTTSSSVYRYPVNSPLNNCDIIALWETLAFRIYVVDEDGNPLTDGVEYEDGVLYQTWWYEWRDNPIIQLPEIEGYNLDINAENYIRHVTSTNDTVEFVIIQSKDPIELTNIISGAEIWLTYVAVKYVQNDNGTWSSTDDEDNETYVKYDDEYIPVTDEDGDGIWEDEDGNLYVPNSGDGSSEKYVPNEDGETYSKDGDDSGTKYVPEDGDMVEVEYEYTRKDDGTWTNTDPEDGNTYVKYDDEYIPVTDEDGDGIWEDNDGNLFIPDTITGIAEKYTNNGDGTYTGDDGYVYKLENGQMVKVTGGTEYKLGDVNRDGDIDYQDAMLVLSAAVGSETLDDEQKLLADVNRDGDADYQDAMLILSYAIGEITSFD